MSDAAPSPPPRWVVLGLAALTLLLVTAASLALFRDDLEPVDDPDDAAVTTVDPGIVADDFERPDADTLADADHAVGGGHGGVGGAGRARHPHGRRRRPGRRRAAERDRRARSPG